MLRIKIIPSIAVVLCAAGFSACQKEEVLPDDALYQARQSAVAAGAQVLHADLSVLYRQASKLDDAAWLELPVVTEGQTFPVQRIRRSPMLPRDAKFYTTDGKTLTELARPDLMVVEGLTSDGRRGLFALSPEHFAGWYEAPEGRMYVQDLAFDHPEAETGELIVLSESQWQRLSPVSGHCGSPLAAGKPTPIDQPAGNVPEANCWKLELIMHGDWHYFSGVAGSNVGSAQWGLMAYAVLSDPPFAAINMDLVVPTMILTQTPTSFTTNPSGLLGIVQNFWSHFPTNRDAVVYVTGADLAGSVIGIAYLKTVCNNVPWAVSVVQWMRGPLGSLSQSQANGRIGAHEIGHNLDAQHTTAGIMTPAIGGSGSSGSFSQTSRDQMNWHIWFNHNCLHQATCN
jgi:hypothetical protein